MGVRRVVSTPELASQAHQIPSQSSLASSASSASSNEMSSEGCDIRGSAYGGGGGGGGGGGNGGNGGNSAAVAAVAGGTSGGGGASSSSGSSSSGTEKGWSLSRFFRPRTLQKAHLGDDNKLFFPHPFLLPFFASF